MEAVGADEAELLAELTACLSDEPPLKITRKLLRRGDQGCSLVERSLLAGVPEALLDRAVGWAVAEPSRRANRAMGALVGLAVGDWVGAPLEFLQAVNEPCSSRWDHSGFCHQSPNTCGKKRGNLKHGQFSDDTSMALCLADSLIQRGRLDGSDLRIRFWNWHAEGLNNAFRFDLERPKRTSFGLGCNISKSLLCLEPGSAVAAVYVSPGCNDSGNGGLMRLAPVPIFYSASERLNEALEAARQSSLSTHPGDLATETAAFLAFVIHRAINRRAEVGSAVAAGDKLSPAATFLDACCNEYAAMLTARLESRHDGAPSAAAATEARPAGAQQEEEEARLASSPGAAPLEGTRVDASGHDDRGGGGVEGAPPGGEGTPTAAAIRQLRALLTSAAVGDREQCWNWRGPVLRVSEALAARGEEYNGHPVSRAYFGSYCMDGLAAALFAVASTSSFNTAIERAVNILGDADSIGAIAGQIAGAFYGYSDIDERYVSALRKWDRGETACRALLCFLSGHK